MKNDKILLVGANGNMGSKHLRVLTELKEKYGFQLKTCDIKGNTDFKDYKEAYKSFKPNKVIIATPTPTHSELLQYFNGLVYSIFIEKPIVDDGSEDLYLLTKSKIMVGHIERYNPIIEKIRELLNGKKITHVICLRCGLPQTKAEENVVIDENIDKDLIIHDVDVVQYITQHNKLINDLKNLRTTIFTKITERNQSDLFTEINGVKCFFHADKTSPSKVRIIKVLGQNYILEGDYISQTLLLNGTPVEIEKKEPLKVELETFIDEKFDKIALKDAINNLKILNGKHITYKQ